MSGLDPAKRRRIGITAGIVAAVVFSMTGLAFAAAPLYSAFCRITGYGGTTQTATAAPSRVLERRIQVRFDANVAPGLPVEFAPEQNEQNLHLGETGLAFYRVRNTRTVQSRRLRPIMSRHTRWGRISRSWNASAFRNK